MAMLPEEFYRSKILTCSPRKSVDLPGPRDYNEIRIEKSLFEWRLYYSKKRYLCCPSEWEARYLKVWLEGGLNKIEMPSNEELLKNITLELEKLSLRILKLADEKLAGYREPIKREVLQGVWQVEESK
ncbi:MAG: hypothetical protein NT009_06180 [Proteobacteria bacterium]|nr:hypothetical protein [Pseudomonadota bacterium]